MKCIKNLKKILNQSAMRRAGANPTDVEVTDIINKIDNETGALDFQVNKKRKPISFNLIVNCYRNFVQ